MSEFVFCSKKCRVYAACDVSQTPITDKIWEGIDYAKSSS